MNLKISAFPFVMVIENLGADYLRASVPEV